MPAMPAAPDQERTEIEPVEPVDRNFIPKSENIMRLSMSGRIFL